LTSCARLLLKVVAALAVIASVRASGPPVKADSCFPVEGLPTEDRLEAEELFLRILDSEGLYTVVGGIKPASSGFVRFVLDAGAESLEPVDRARRLLATFRCGDLVFATVHHFRRIYGQEGMGKGKRHYEGIVFAVEPLRRLVRLHEREFALLGVSPHSHPMEVLMAVEYANEPGRWRGYGRLFGFPPAAVAFFVEAGSLQQSSGVFVKRRFVSLPTFERPDRGVVYAVAEDAGESEDDLRLRRAVEGALADYKARRERYIGPGKQGVTRLLRDWFCRGKKLCSLPAAPAN